MTSDDLLAHYPPRIRKLANRLRRILHAAVPTFTERALPGWKAISFRDPQAGHVCGIFPFDDEVRLYFEHGARLADPSRLMTRTLKRGGMIRYRSERDVRVRALMRLVRDAVLRQSV